MEMGQLMLKEDPQPLLDLCKVLLLLVSDSTNALRPEAVHSQNRKKLESNRALFL